MSSREAGQSLKIIHLQEGLNNSILPNYANLVNFQQLQRTNLLSKISTNEEETRRQRQSVPLQ
jgi:hypothetical protein